MEAKKTDNADLGKKSTFFLSIGLLVTMILVLSAFEWKDYDDSLIDLAGKNMDAFDETMEVPPTEQPPPPAPVIQQPQVIEVPDEEEIKEDIKVNLDVEVTDQSKVEEIVVQADEPKEETDEVFTIVEESATPKGGIQAFYKYVSEKLANRYPPQARRMGIEGRVFVEFVIGKDGSISEVRSIKGIGAGCDEEAIKVVQGSPPWNPGKQRGKPVRQKYTLPIIFKLG